MAGARLAGASYPPIPAGPILIGVTTSLVGPSAAYGIETEQGWDLGVKAFNSEFPNGIDGHQLKLVLLNDEGTVAGVVQATNQLVADKVVADVDLSNNPEATLEQAAVLNHAHIPVIGSLDLDQLLNAKAYPYDFGVDATTPQDAIAAAKWLKKGGFTRVAVMDDGLEGTDQTLSNLEADLPKYSPNTKVVTVQQIPPASVAVAAQVAALKAANPDVVYIDISEEYGPIWQAMITAGMTNVKILTSAGAWYDGFTAMGPLEANAFAAFENCVPSASTTYPASLSTLMAQYSAITSNSSTNYLTYVSSDSVPEWLLKYAIDKEHSDSPAAIQAGMLSIHNQSLHTFQYNFTPNNHAGIEGINGAAVCQLAPPYAGGIAKVPLISNG